jgi:hypothetical protein
MPGSRLAGQVAGIRAKMGKLRYPAQTRPPSIRMGIQDQVGVFGLKHAIGLRP